MSAPALPRIEMTDLDLAGKRVLIREDLNVPLTDGAITSDARIVAALPGIRAALEDGGSGHVSSWPAGGREAGSSTVAGAGGRAAG